MYDFIALKKGTIFYNADDDVLNSILPGGIDSISFGKKNKNISGNIVESSPFIGFSWKSSVYQSSTIKTHLIGEYNFYNFLLAVCIASHFKIDEEKINHSLSSYQPTNNRSQIQKTNANTVIMDCYNANPSSVLAALKSFNLVENENKIAILGDMLELGKISSTEHQKIYDFLQNNRINFITVGKEFKKLQHPQRNFENVELLIHFLKNKPIENAYVLLKGSRGIQLEKLIELNAL